MLTSVVMQSQTRGSEATREAARELGQAAGELARARTDAARAQAEVRSAEQAVARAQSDGAREAARARLDQARESYQEAQEHTREAEQAVREAQQSVREAAQEEAQQARDAAQQAREIAQQVREQIQVPTPPTPPDVRTTIHLPPRRPDDGGPQVPQVPQEAVVISLGFFFTVAFIAVGWPIARAFGRRVDRKTVAGAGAAQIPAELSARLERIEHSVEAIAIEVERISEGQRFATKLLSENRPVQQIAAGQNVPELVERK